MAQLQAVEEEEVLTREHDSAIDSEECEVIDRTKQYAAIRTRPEWASQSARAGIHSTSEESIAESFWSSWNFDFKK
jgi:hypothetical protein